MINKISKKLAIAFAGLGIATTGTFGALYVNEAINTQTIKANEMAEITSIINQLRSMTGSVQTTEAELRDYIEQKITETNDSLNNIMVDYVSNSISEMSDEIQGNDENHDLLKNEVARQTAELQNQLDLIKSGIIGTHDLTYYKTILDSSVSDSQFTNFAERIDGLDDSVAKIETNNTTTKTQMDAITTTINDPATGLVKTIGDLDTWAKGTLADMVDYNTSNLAATNALSNANKLAIEILEADLTATLTKITKITDNATVTSDDIAGLKVTIAGMQTAINGNGETLNNFHDSVSNLENSIQALEEESLKAQRLLNEYEGIIKGVLATDATFEAKFNQLQLKVEGFTTATNNQFAVVNNSILQLDNQFTTLANAVTNNTMLIDELKTLVATTTTKATEELTTLKSLIDDNSKLINANKTKFTEVDNEIAHFKVSIPLIQADVEDLKVKVKNFGLGVEATKTSIADILNKLDALILRMDAAEAKLNKVEDRLAALENANVIAGDIAHKTILSNDTLSIGNLGRSWDSALVLPTGWEDYNELTLTMYGNGWNGEAILITNTIAWEKSWFQPGHFWGGTLHYGFFTNIMGQYKIALNSNTGKVVIHSVSYSSNVSFVRATATHNVK